MNIIGGKLKGKKLLTLEGRDTRPTLTRIKENIFNILQNYTDFEDLIVVDIFGGSGSLGLESLSRGAKFTYFNDKNIKACNVIKKNIDSCRFNELSSVSNLDYKTFFKTFSSKIDLLLIDPPFADVSCQQWIINYCFQNQLLNQGALIVLETNVYLENLVLEPEFTILSEKKYSKIYITIIEYQNK